MKKLSSFLLILQFCNWCYGMDNNNAEDLSAYVPIQLPRTAVIKKCLERFFFPDFFYRTTVLTDLGKAKSKHEVTERLNSNVSCYVKIIDQPETGKFFETQALKAIEEIEKTAKKTIIHYSKL